MLSNTAMRRLRDAYFHHLPTTESEVLTVLGNPSREEIIDTALAGLESSDRNTRVLMLRVLKGQSGRKAMAGILTGLDDGKRRVKRVAIQSSSPFLHYTEVTTRLEEIYNDDREHRKVRGAALSCLANLGATDFMKKTLTKDEISRTAILYHLLQLDLTDEIESLLNTFVKDGTKEEAVMATKALCGYRVITLGAFENDRPAQKEIRETCESAGGRVFFWMKRTEFKALLKAGKTK